MSGVTDKLTVEDCEAEASSIGRFPDEQRVYKQLADTMRWNLKLQKILNDIGYSFNDNAGEPSPAMARDAKQGPIVPPLGGAANSPAPDHPTQNTECVHPTTDIYGICPQCGHKVR